MPTRTQEIRGWAGNYVEDETEEMLTEINDEAEDDLIEIGREGAAEATENFFVNLIYGNSPEMDREDIRGDIRDIPVMAEAISEVSDRISIDSLAEMQGDLYRIPASESINENLEDEVSADLDDFPARQKYDQYIDNMLDVAVNEGLEAAKDPSVLYEAIRQEHPTKEDYDEFFRQRQRNTVNVMKQQMSQMAEEIGDKPEVAENAVEQYKEDLLDAMSPLHEGVRERWTEKIYGKEVS